MRKKYQQKVAISLIELVYVFPPQFRHLDFTYIIINVGELIFCGHEWWTHCKLSNQYAVPFNKAANNCVMDGWGTISYFERNDCECYVPVWRQKSCIILLWGYKWLKEQFFFLKESNASFHFHWSQILSMVCFIHMVWFTSYL
jgi:hypothetical protein